jgi:lipoate-protein ligase B
MGGSSPEVPSGVKTVDVKWLAACSYDHGYTVQVAKVDEVVAARDRGGDQGTIHLLEHAPAVITISRRPQAASHLLASPDRLAADGIEVRETDRGGDITYHGPGQLVAYPNLDLNIFNLGLHDYMRLLEESVIRACAGWGIAAERDPDATGVWVGGSKICAMGVRVRKWVSMHGLAINVSTNLRHFDHIVPCGLAGRGVTSLRALLGDDAPGVQEAGERIARELKAMLLDRADSVAARRRVSGTS